MVSNTGTLDKWRGSGNGALCVHTRSCFFTYPAVKPLPLRLGELWPAPLSQRCYSIQSLVSEIKPQDPRSLMPLVVKMVVTVWQEIQSIPSVPISSDFLFFSFFGRKTKIFAVGRGGSVLLEKEEVLPAPLPPPLHSENEFPTVEPKALLLLFPLELSGWSPLCRACVQVLSRWGLLYSTTSQSLHPAQRLLCTLFMPLQPKLQTGKKSPGPLRRAGSCREESAWHGLEQTPSESSSKLNQSWPGHTGLHTASWDF